MTSRFDEEFGGFGYSPKFPTPTASCFGSLPPFKDTPQRPLWLKRLCSRCIRAGFSTISYGFSRYSTDERWLVPHFEMMLYDNALLTISRSKPLR